MAGLTLSFNIEGDQQLLRHLDGIDAKAKNWKPEFAKTGQMLIKTFSDNFTYEGAMLGDRWEPLKPSTLAEKKRLGYSDKILVRTGAMRFGFNSRSYEDAVIIWNSSPYFPYHQSNKPRFKLPRRVMMKLDEKRKQMIVKIFQASLQAVLQQRRV